MKREICEDSGRKFQWRWSALLNVENLIICIDNYHFVNNHNFMR